MYHSGSRPWNPARGRGRGRGGSKPTNQPTSVKLPPARDWMQSLVPVPIGIFDANTLCFVKDADSPAHHVDQRPFEQQENITFEDFKYIGSYNWTNRPGQIIVPGSPRVWKNVVTPFTAKNDLELNPGGTRFVDQNSHRFPDAPLLPLFEAVDEVQSSNGTVFDWVSADFISDRNGLRKLIRWAEASAKLNDFRIDAELVGYRTILLGRWEPRTLDEATSWTFGFGFEHATTVPATGCEEGTGHHRIVTYDFGGLQMVVRYEVDACGRSSPDAAYSPSPSGGNVDDLADLLAVASLTDAKKHRDHTQLSIIRAGSVVPQADILELTTRSVRNAPDFDWSEALPQLHLSGTPVHILGVHERGTFREMRKTRIGGAELRSAEAKAQLGLRKLRIVLESIQDVLVGGDLSGKKVSLVCRDGKLKLYERNGTDLVPESVLKRFEQ